MAKKATVIVLPVELIESEAFRTLNGTAKQVLLRFLSKRQIIKANGKKGRNHVVQFLNNGEIVYSFKEAQDQDGLSAQQFNGALKALKARGFINVNRPGGRYRVMTTYYVHLPDDKELWREWKFKS